MPVRGLNINTEFPVTHFHSTGYKRKAFGSNKQSKNFLTTPLTESNWSPRFKPPFLQWDNKNYLSLKSIMCTLFGMGTLRMEGKQVTKPRVFQQFKTTQFENFNQFKKIFNLV